MRALFPCGIFVLFACANSRRIFRSWRKRPDCSSAVVQGAQTLSIDTEDEQVGIAGYSAHSWVPESRASVEIVARACPPGLSFTRVTRHRGPRGRVKVY